MSEDLKDKISDIQKEFNRILITQMMGVKTVWIVEKSTWMNFREFYEYKMETTKNKNTIEKENQKLKVAGNIEQALVICCGHFEKYAKQFRWFIRLDENKNKFYCMPYLEVGKDKIRINHCPICGVEIRNVEYTVEQFANLK